MRTLITHFYNEEYLLPFWIKHHRDVFDNAILINYRSTDNSARLIKKLAPSSWEIVDSVNENFDAQLCDLEVMQHEKMVEGWKIALNVTEFFVCPNLELIEQECEKKDLNGFRASGIVMVDNQEYLKINPNISLVDQKIFGFLESSFDFNAHKLAWYSEPCRSRIYHKCKTGLYFPGRHKSFLSKIPHTINSAYTMWYGFSPWNQEFLKRKIQISQKLAPSDIKRGWGAQHVLDYSDLNKIKNYFLKQSYDLKEILEESRCKKINFFSDLSKDEVLYDDFGLLNIRSASLIAERASLIAERASLIAERKHIFDSTSWKITKPLRFFSRNFVKKLYPCSMSLVKRIYQSLPLDCQTKATHRGFIVKYFPRILLASGAHSATIPLLSLRSALKVTRREFYNPQEFAKGIVIPLFEHPLISVVIPIYGKIEYTLRCLDSIASTLPQAKFEIIVVDDCSPDNSVEILSGIPGICLIKNIQNQGFIRSCNAGSIAAKGEYLYFLNNDTEVTTGWLDALLRTFQDFPGTGLAGSKLIYPDGRLQEAGGIIWQDGSAWNFGRFQDPLLPVYNYAREVDYCSGASIMVSKVLFDELNGFDELYLPAYCEDSDLAMKIRDKGYRVIYQPLSTVIHYEGITSGTDTTQGTKAYQVENSKKLFERWQHRLQTHQAPGTDVDNAKDRRATRRVLVLDHCTPTPNQDAGSVTAFNLLLLLREMDFQVTFIPVDNFLYMPEYTTALQRAGIEVLYAPYVTTVDQHLKEYGNRYNLAFLFRPGVVERHLKAIRKLCPQAKVLFHTVDLHFLRMSREAELQSDKAKQKVADKMKQRELAAIRAVDVSIVHSTAELEILRSLLLDAKLHVFPLIMDIKGTSKTFVERRDIVFIGGYQHTPNVDAVKYFVKEIMPLLRKQLPGVRFFVVGSKPSAEIRELVSDDVIVTGFVEDLTTLLDKMRISVAPLRYGAGIKGKIGTAMAVGLPVVATTIAAEGMSLNNGENILVADGAMQFANEIVSLYEDETLWKRISHNGLVFADNAWGAEEAWNTLHKILAECSIVTDRCIYSISLYSESDSTVKESQQHQNNVLTPDGGKMVFKSRKIAGNLDASTEFVL